MGERCALLRTCRDWKAHSLTCRGGLVATAAPPGARACLLRSPSPLATPPAASPSPSVRPGTVFLSEPLLPAASPPSLIWGSPCHCGITSSPALRVPVESLPVCHSCVNGSSSSMYFLFIGSFEFSLRFRPLLHEVLYGFCYPHVPACSLAAFSECSSVFFFF